MGKGIVISVRQPEDIVKRIDAVSENRGDFVKAAIEEKLNPAKVEVPELTDREKRGVLKDAKKLSELLNDAMLRRMEMERDLLDNMPRDDFLKLVAGRLPKFDIGDPELEQEVQSLRKCLDEMPSIEDITKELNRVKGEQYKAERERDLNIKLLEHGKNKAELGELMEAVYRGCVEWIVNMAARNALPGVGEGGGLTERGYEQVSKKVKSELENLMIYRGGR